VARRRIGMQIKETTGDPRRRARGTSHKGAPGMGGRQEVSA
jgi:hypothetical protein